MQHELGFFYDEDDAALVRSHEWHLNKSGHAVYVRSTDTGEYLHRLVTGAPKGMDVDHINGDGLDCQKGNLRVVTRSQNNMNRRSQRDGEKGIHLDAKTGKWRAELWAYGKRYRSQRFAEKDDALGARRAMEAAHHGQYSGMGTSA